MLDFGKDFVWGVATAAYQIEGGRNEDGKTDSIWDVFTHKKGIVVDGSTGDIACDSYHRLEEDLDLLKALRVKAYRFSVSWSRVLPDGVGQVNEKGVAYYNRLIDGLLSRGITPYLTLYHWDLPQVLQEMGGFSNKEFPKWFAYYAKTVAENFGDRVKHYFTFNEPPVIFDNAFAPGVWYTLKEQLARVHHMLLAHGLAVKELRKIPQAKIGFALCGLVPVPAEETQENYDLAKKWFFSMNKGYPYSAVTLYADPIFFGKYPDEYYEYYKDVMPEIGENDMEIISQPLDFLGQNTYQGEYFKVETDEHGEKSLVQLPRKKGESVTAFGWYKTPKSLYYVSKYLYERYKMPLFIAENGIACLDFIYSDGKVHDMDREEYLRTHLVELARAKVDGVDIEGYFYWSFLDNFEWMQGYTKRFGLVYVDFETCERTPKESFAFYRKVIESDGEILFKK